MTSQDVIELRRIAQQLAVLAERLDNMTIGVQPISKRDAAARLEELRIMLHRVADPSEDKTDIKGRPIQ